jgi:tetratricopeptide (TPR) repeat protein
MLRKRWEEAVPWLRRYVEEQPDEGPLELAQTLMLVGMCLGALGRVDEALEWFGRSASAVRRREPLYEAALVLIKACRLEDAIDWIERMRAIPASVRLESRYDLPGVWGDLEPLRMLAFCRTEIARAKATWEKRAR